MKTFVNRKLLFRSTLVAAALAAGLGATGPVLADTGDAADPQPHSDSVAAAISDTAITAELKARYLGEERLKTSQISVTTTNGVVTLTGTAGNPEAKSVAVELAKSVEGVKSVDGEDLSIPSAAVTISPAAHRLAKTTKRAISDSVITAKVKSELLADSVSKGFDVSVSTKHGVVTLSGNLANPGAIDHVKDVAERVAGVKSVDTSRLSSRGG
jgi:hyperosmotically inducible periplasmic protein